MRAVPASLLPRAGFGVPMETAFTAPGPHTDWADRPHLVQRMTDTAARLILVAAPAGSGKTTLVAQWRASTLATRLFAWISVDGGDNDAGQLCWHIVQALRRASPQFGADEVLRQLREPGVRHHRNVLPILVNELAALPGRVVLVLDDYQVITEPRCHDQLAFLLLHLPPPVQIVLITGQIPPLPLARLRATGEMAEFRARDLRFGLAETAWLVRAISAVELSGPDLAVLVERTEGWPAGLFLAAHSLRGHPAPSGFVGQFTGQNRYIADFMTEEVLGRQPAEIREFLVRTSVLDRFCAPLCDAVAGRTARPKSWTCSTGRTSSSFRWTKYGSGTGITISSRRLCGDSSPGPSPASPPPCTSARAPGTGDPGRRARRSVTRSPPVTGLAPAT